MSDPFARLSSFIESAREITIEAAVSASTRLSETPSAKRPQEISKLLNSRTDREVLNGIKCVIALIANGEEANVYFADVVKNVTSSNARVRALVMIYIEKFAENEPDTALLSINSIQKALGGRSNLARGASIRALAGIKIPEIASLLLLCIKRMLPDRSSHVRSATALAIGSAFGIEGINKQQLLSFLSKLLSDPCTKVVSSSIIVFMKLKPLLIQLSSSKAWAPIHANFRRYVRVLNDLDEWARCLLIDLLAEYCRKFLPAPKLTLSDGAVIPAPDEFALYPNSYTYQLDPDLEAFIDALETSFFFSSELVVLSAARAMISVATRKQIIESKMSKVLIKLMLGTQNALRQSFTLQIISHIAKSIPETFSNRYKHFFLHSKDTNYVASKKFEILSSLCSNENAKMTIRELQYNSFSHESKIAKHAVKSIGVCCQKSPELADVVLDWCIIEMKKPSAFPILVELLTVVRWSLQEKHFVDPSNEKINAIVYSLSQMLSESTFKMAPEAEASVIWMIGEFTDTAKNKIGPDILRQFVKQYAAMPERVRYEILLLSAKSYSFELANAKGEQVDEKPCAISRDLFNHFVKLARVDTSTTIRDRVRMLEELFRDASNHQLASLFMQTPKKAPKFFGPEASLPILAHYLELIPRTDPSNLPSKSIRKEYPMNVALTRETDLGKNSKTTVTSRNPIGDMNYAQSSSGLVAESNKLQSLDEFFGNDNDSNDSYISEDNNSSNQSSSERSSLHSTDFESEDELL